jgi:hypothetical protein
VDEILSPLSSHPNGFGHPNAHGLNGLALEQWRSKRILV